MKEIKNKLCISNSSINFSFISINNFMNKTFNKDNKKTDQKINTPFKKEILMDDCGINVIHRNKNKKETQLKRIWSSQNIFLSNNNNKISRNFNHNQNFYFDSSLFIPPSFTKNKKEINKLINNIKNSRYTYVNNIHNSTLIKESKLYRKKLQV